MEKYFLKQTSHNLPISEEGEAWAVGFSWDVKTERASLNLKPTKCRVIGLQEYTKEEFLANNRVNWLHYYYKDFIENEKQDLMFSVNQYRAKFLYFVGKKGQRLAKRVPGAPQIFLVESEQAARQVYLMLLERGKQEVWNFFKNKMESVQTYIDKESKKFKS